MDADIERIRLVGLANTLVPLIERVTRLYQELDSERQDRLSAALCDYQPLANNLPTGEDQRVFRSFLGLVLPDAEPELSYVLLGPAVALILSRLGSFDLSRNSFARPEQPELAEHARAVLNVQLFPEISISLDDWDLVMDLEGDPEENRRTREKLDAEEAFFREAVQRLATQKGMSIEALGQRADLAPGALEILLAQKLRPQRRTVMKLARALGVEVEELWPAQKQE